MMNDENVARSNQLVMLYLERSTNGNTKSGMDTASHTDTNNYIQAIVKWTTRV